MDRVQNRSETEQGKGSTTVGTDFIYHSFACSVRPDSFRENGTDWETLVKKFTFKEQFKKHVTFEMFD